MATNRAFVLGGLYIALLALFVFIQREDYIASFSLIYSFFAGLLLARHFQ
jgi:hypothetical protein